MATLYPKRPPKALFVVDGQEFGVWAASVDDDDMDDVIDLEHVRRARRLIPILVDRFGVAWFLKKEKGTRARINEERIDRCVVLAEDWIACRSGRSTSPSMRPRLRRWLKIVIDHRIASGAACVR